MTDEDLDDDLSELFDDESPEDRYQSVKDRIDALTTHFHTSHLRIEEDIFNAGLDTIKSGILVIYSSLHEEH